MILVNSPDFVNMPKLVPQAKASPPRLAVMLSQKLRQLWEAVRPRPQKGKRRATASLTAVIAGAPGSPTAALPMDPHVAAPAAKDATADKCA